MRIALASLVVALLGVLGAGRAEAAITVTFNSQPPPILVAQSSPMPVSVDVSSTYDLASVVARVDTVSTTMMPATLPTWNGTMNLTSLPYGNLVVVVTATDVFGATATASRPFMHDEPPVITVMLPVPNSVARPTLRVMATCSDDNPGGICMNFGAGTGNGGGLSGAGTNMIDGTIDLTAMDGTAGRMFVTANGPFGNLPGVPVPIFVENSPDLAHVATLGVRVLDIDETRILYIDGAGMVRTRARTGGAETVLGPIADQGTAPPYGRLTSTGAVYVSMNAPMGACDPEELFEWRGSGAAVSLGRPCQANGFSKWSLAGDWGFRYELSSNPTRRNFATGVSAVVTYPPDVGLPYGNSFRHVLGRQGELVRTIADGDDVRFVRDLDGVQTEIGRGRSGQVNPVYDGTALAFLQRDNPNDRVSLARAGMPALVLGDPLIPQYPHLTYNVGGGFVAFTRRSMTSGARQIWRRNLDGSEQNLTPFASDSVVDAVATNGNVTVITGGQTRYLATDGAGLPQHLGSELGRTVFLSDGVYIVIGRSVLRHGSGGVPIDAGVPDAASAVDAGVDNDAAAAGGGGSGGGACAAGGHGVATGGLAALGLALARLRRRRQRAA